MKSASTLLLALSALLSIGLAAPLGRVEGVRALFRISSFLSLFHVDIFDVFFGVTPRTDIWRAEGNGSGWKFLLMNCLTHF